MRKTILLSFSLLATAMFGFGQIDTTTINYQAKAFPVIILSTSDLDRDEDKHYISELLQSTSGVFISTAGNIFGSVRFRLRGYESERSSVLINGVILNDPETGYAFDSNWGGLNDAMGKTINTIGFSASEIIFGGVGGTNNIILRPTENAASTHITYSGTNSSYRHRTMFTHSTGLVDDNWAMILSGSRRWAQEGYVKGTFFDAYAYLIALEKKYNKSNSFVFSAFDSPSKSALSGIAVQETYDLTGDSYYNPNWGYQNGKVRNARVNSYHKPMLLLTHYGTFGKTNVTTTAAYSFGKGGTTAINWRNASPPAWDEGSSLMWVPGSDPRPDYYRYLPSYYKKTDEYTFNKLTNLWKDDEYFRQINWDHFYFANSDEISSESEGNRSKYIVEERRNDNSQWLFNSNARHQLNNNIILTGGVNASLFKGFQFKVVNDLLGGDWWKDVDPSAERDYEDEQYYQNDLNNPNQLIKVGDKFGYDYTVNINQANLFAQSEFSYTKVDFFVAANLAYTSFWRTGNMKNGRFPDNSYGNSEKQNFLNYGVKGGVTFKITGRHYLDLNAGYQTKAPYFHDSFISSRVRNHVVDGLKEEHIFAGDVSYIVRTPVVKSKATVFYSENLDQTWNRSFYHEDYNSFVNYIMTGVDSRNIGVELGVEITITPEITVNAVGAWGHYTYSSRPNVTIARDNSDELIAESNSVYFKNLKLGGFPQTAASVGFLYNSPRRWFVGGNTNYFGKWYIEANPVRRTEEAMDALVTSDSQWSDLLNQQKLNDEFTVDLLVGKSWQLKNNSFIRANLSISNVLNNKSLTVVSFEQLRFDAQNVNSFPPKFAYMYGTNFFLNLNFSF